jgi:O-antigen ligase
VAVCLLAGWAKRGFGNWSFGRAKPVVALLIAYWMWTILGAWAAPNQEVAWQFAEQISKIVIPVVVGATTIDSVRKLKQLAWVVLLSQGYLAFELNSLYFSGRHQILEDGFLGMDNNVVGLTMATGTGLAFFLGILADRWWKRGIAFVLGMLMVHVVLFAFTRGGMLALLITGLVSFLLIPKKPAHILMLIVAVALGLRLAGAEVRERFMTMFADKEVRDDSAQSRIDLSLHCIDAMLREPVFGVGPNHWPLICVRYGYPPGKMAHTHWLAVGAEQGIIGFLCMIGFYGICMLRLWKLLRRKWYVPDPWLVHGARMVIASLVGFAVAAQFLTIYGIEIPYYVALIGIGILKLTPTQARAGAETAADVASVPPVDEPRPAAM